MKKSVLSGAALPISWHECSEHEPGERKHTHTEDDIPGHPCPDQRLHDRAMDEFRRTRIGIAMFNTGIGLQDTLRQQRQELGNVLALQRARHAQEQRDSFLKALKESQESESRRQYLARQNAWAGFGRFA